MNCEHKQNDNLIIIITRVICTNHILVDIIYFNHPRDYIKTVSVYLAEETYKTLMY